MNVSAWRTECGSSPDGWACIFAAMKYVQDETDLEITLTPQAPPVATVILLHGLGADGSDFVPIVGELGLPETLPVRFVFPHAPLRPVTVNNGYVMRASYDVGSVRAGGPGRCRRRRSNRRSASRAASTASAPAACRRRVWCSRAFRGRRSRPICGLALPQTVGRILAISCYLPFPGAARDRESRRPCRRAQYCYVTDGVIQSYRSHKGPRRATNWWRTGYAQSGATTRWSTRCCMEEIAGRLALAAGAAGVGLRLRARAGRLIRLCHPFVLALPTTGVADIGRCRSSASRH